MDSRTGLSEDSLVLAFETGGTKLVAGIAGADWRIAETTTVRRDPADRAPHSFGRIVMEAERLLARSNLTNRVLRCVGFGFGGTVRRSTNSPHRCLHEDGWEDVDVVGELQGRFGVPVYVENDCKLAALAETHFGAGRGARSVFYVTLGTGVGGGFVREGRIVTLGDLGEAEIGHVVVDPEGPECACGNRGCVEALCSGPGLARLAALLAARDSFLWNFSTVSEGGPPYEVPSERIVDAWKAGDAFAQAVMQHALTGLASALAATVNLLVPERIVIGGVLGTSSDRLLAELRARMEPLVVPYFRGRFRVVGSQLGETAVTQGAAVLAGQRAAARGRS